LYIGLLANVFVMYCDCSGTGDSPCPTNKEGIITDVSRDVGARELALG
jgi:hypothetical protein